MVSNVLGVAGGGRVVPWRWRWAVRLQEWHERPGPSQWRAAPSDVNKLVTPAHGAAARRE